MASYLMARTFAYDPRRFQWLTRLHVVAIACLVIIAFLVQRASSIYYITTIIMVLGAFLLVVSMLITAVPPMVTKHAITGDAVVLKQGAFFEFKIPFASIGKVEQTDDIPSRPGIKASRMESALYVLATTKGAVRFDLKEHLRYKGIALDFVVADFDKPEEFLSCLEERMEGERILAKHDGKKKRTSKKPVEYPRDPLLPPPKFKKAVIENPDIPDEVMEPSGEDESVDGRDEDEELGGTEDEDEEPPEDDDVTPGRIPPPKPGKESREVPAPAPAKEIDVRPPKGGLHPLGHDEVLEDEYVAVPAWGSGASAEERPRIVRIPKRKIK